MYCWGLGLRGRRKIRGCNIIKAVCHGHKGVVAGRPGCPVTANLALVNLYWDIGRIITQDIQKNRKRAGCGEQLLENLEWKLTQEYGQGYSVSNLNDIRRFYGGFEILQAVSVESSDRLPRSQIDQTPSNEFPPHLILQTASGKSSCETIWQALPAESSDSILIDFSRHFHVGWARCRILSGVEEKYG